MNWQSATFSDLVDVLLGIIDILIAVVFTITLVVILWQIIKAWILRGGDPNAIEEGKKTIFIGFIVLVVMVAVWGIVALLQSAIAL